MSTALHCGILAGLLALSAATGVKAQAASYPDKPVQIIADSSAGSTPDVALRFVAEQLTKLWGQQVTRCSAHSRTTAASTSAHVVARQPGH